MITGKWILIPLRLTIRSEGAQVQCVVDGSKISCCHEGNKTGLQPRTRHCC